MPAATVDHSQRICEVWACNLDEEMKKIRQVIRKYNYVAMVSGCLMSVYQITAKILTSVEVSELAHPSKFESKCKKMHF